MTYVPIPQSPDAHHPALLSVDLPRTVRKGQVFTVVARQVTSVPAPKDRDAARATAGWRQVLGAFQMTIPVRVKEEMLDAEEQTLSVLLRIQATIPTQSRWRLVFDRYVQQTAGRVKGLGGDPGAIGPWPHEHGGGPPSSGHGASSWCAGKVSGLVYDRFGDFVGFTVDTGSGDRTFRSTERRVEELARRAWIDRTSLAVRFDPKHPDRAVEIVLRRHGGP